MTPKNYPELIARLERARSVILIVLADRPDSMGILDRLEAELAKARAISEKLSRAKSCLSHGRAVISKSSAS